MKEKMKRIEEYTKAMRELLDKLLEQNPDSENEIYDEIYDEIWGAYVAGMKVFLYLLFQLRIKTSWLLLLFVKAQKLKREIQNGKPGSLHPLTDLEVKQKLVGSLEQTGIFN